MINIALNSVTSLAWSTYGTGHTHAIFQVDEKALLLRHVLMI